jgi:predicted nucleotidyltransferase
MGKVFSPEQIKSGDIPEDGAHEKAGRYVLESLFDPPGLWVPINETRRQLNYDVMQRVSGINAGMVYGSTALGSANVRSDLDVLVTYYTNHPQVLTTMREVFEETQKRFKVPVEHHIVPVVSLLSPLEHTIDPLFAKHLFEIQAQDEPRWSYNWPVDGLRWGDAVDEQQVRALAIRYCSAKRRQLVNGTVDYRGNPNYAVMQRALELPAAIGRKVLAATDGQDKVDQQLLQDKSEMMGTLLDRYNSSRISYMGEPDKSLADLSELDFEYDDLLASTIGGETALKDYSEWTDVNYLRALELGAHVATSWVEILQNNLDKPQAELAELQLPDSDTEDHY